MKIAGFIKNSLIDYPDKICTTIFTAGCNMNCWYCHNYKLLSGEQKDYYHEVLEFLKLRVGQIDAVTISGGEPTINKDLEAFIKEVKAFGYLIKLDTNGLNPQVLKNLIDKNMLDYVAMDIKAPFNKYENVIRTNINLEKIKESMSILKNSNINYEFRTTFSPDLNFEDISSIGALVKGAKNFSLQNYRPTNRCENIAFLPHKPSIVEMAYNIIKKYVPNAILKGL